MTTSDSYYAHILKIFVIGSSSHSYNLYETGRKLNHVQDLNERFLQSGKFQKGLTRGGSFRLTLKSPKPAQRGVAVQAHQST